MGKSARLLAPVAIASVAVGIYFIVHSTVGAGHDGATVTQSRSVPVATTRRGVSVRPAVYVVKSGDTLTAIARSTGVSLTSLEALNPSLTPPYALRAGQRLRLRR